MELSSTITRKGEMIESQLDNETAMMSMENGRYFGINLTGTRIWQLTKQPITIGEIKETLLQEFKVTPEHCSKVLFEFIEKLQEQELIEVN